MKEKRQIVNIVNFIRGIEPRRPMDLVTPVKEQIRLMQENNLPGTFLLQYDALLSPVYIDLMKGLDPAQFELGVWLEIVQPQVEAVGLNWRGRYPWDWHAHCGFSVGYTKEEREKLIDELWQKFFSVFGYYPRVFGSWLFDSHTLRYVTERYGLDAACNCKEQYGTDGYTLWGGYYGQAYYPARANVFMPAQHQAQQLPAPVFRMLGSDPVYQYDFGMDPQSDAPKTQGVITLEPVYQSSGGGLPAWVDWYMRENYNGECLTFGYAQAGQENSFGWPAMKDGLTYQFSLFAKLRAEGKIEVETLGATGRWFKEHYRVTPASAITAHSAYDDPHRNSVWYSSRLYRINLYGDRGQVRIRDLHVFHENDLDPYENAVCTKNDAVYESLPWIDGNRQSGGGITAGGYFAYEDGTVPQHDAMIFEESGEGRAQVRYGALTFSLEEDGIVMTADKPFTLTLQQNTRGDHAPQVEDVTDTGLSLSYHGVRYTVQVERGCVLSPMKIASADGVIALRFAAL